MNTHAEGKQMNMTKLTRIGIGLWSVALLSGLGWAVETTQLVGSRAMPLSRQGGTARAMSMGSAAVGIPQGSASLFWNPAGLSSLEGGCKELGLHHNSGLGSAINETAVLGGSLGYLGGYAAAVNFVSNGTFEGRDAVGNPTGDYSARDLGASVGWGKQWFRTISAGVAAKFNRQTLASRSYSAFALDLGLLWNPFPRFNAGLTYNNLGTVVADNRLDSGWRIGASYGLDKDLLLAASSELKPDGFDRIQLGLETFFHPDVAVRAGFVHYITDPRNDGATGVTAGLGIRPVKNIMLDYAYLPSGELGSSHRLSFTYTFGCPEKLVPAPIVPMVELRPEPNVVILAKLVILDDTNFKFDTATLTTEGARTVTRNIQVMKDNPAAQIRIAGYTSASGTAEYNQKLSERRAKAVEAILLNEGVSPDRMTTIGYGATRPAMFEPIPKDIDSKAARANMRVLFEIIVK